MSDTTGPPAGKNVIIRGFRVFLFMLKDIQDVRILLDGKLQCL